jgi:hypothetical protein
LAFTTLHDDRMRAPASGQQDPTIWLLTKRQTTEMFIVDLPNLPDVEVCVLGFQPS